VARYAGLTGSPDESGLKRQEKGLAKAGNARVRRGLIQLAWRFLTFQKDSALARWYRMRTEGPSGARKTTVIVALARKLLIALWRLVTTGESLDRPAVHYQDCWFGNSSQRMALDGEHVDTRWGHGFADRSA
jgi:transposase